MEKAYGTGSKYMHLYIAGFGLLVIILGYILANILMVQKESTLTMYDDSMSNSYKNGDILTYKANNKTMLGATADVRRGEVIVLKQYEKDIVKLQALNVLAVPGDKITIKEDTLNINGISFTYVGEIAHEKVQGVIEVPRGCYLLAPDEINITSDILSVTKINEKERYDLRCEKAVHIYEVIAEEKNVVHYLE